MNKKIKAFFLAACMGLSFNIGSSSVEAAQLAEAPSSLVSLEQSGSTIYLGWSYDTRKISGFEIERSFYSSGSWSSLVTVGKSERSYVDGYQLQPDLGLGCRTGLAR